MEDLEQLEHLGRLGSFLGFKKDGSTETIKVLTKEEIKRKRINIVNAILSKVVNDLIKTGIDVPYLKSTAVQSQQQLYDFMYSCALKGYYTEDENKAIIQAHEEAERFLAVTTKLVNDVRRVLFKKIEEDSNDIDELIEYVKSFKISKENITDEVLQSIKERFEI